MGSSDLRLDEAAQDEGEENIHHLFNHYKLYTQTLLLSQYKGSTSLYQIYSGVFIHLKTHDYNLITIIIIIITIIIITIHNNTLWCFKETTIKPKKKQKTRSIVLAALLRTFQFSHHPLLSVWASFVKILTDLVMSSSVWPASNIFWDQQVQHWTWTLTMTFNPCWRPRRTTTGEWF